MGCLGGKRLNTAQQTPGESVSRTQKHVDTNKRSHSAIIIAKPFSRYGPFSEHTSNEYMCLEFGRFLKGALGLILRTKNHKDR